MDTSESKPTDLEMFTPRERVMFSLAIAGMDNREIAELAGIQYQTVKNHFTEIYKKAGVHKRTALILWAMKKGIDRPEVMVPWMVKGGGESKKETDPSA
jgi:DNA-binding NarL/FixJ family response regulator